MRRAGYSNQAISEAIDKLRGLRYLDDTAFARDFATAARDRRLWGPARIAHQLRDRGVSETIIQKTMETVFPEGERASVNRALERFRRVYNQKGTVARKRARAYRHLLSRGFSPEIVYETINGEDEEQESGFTGESASPSDYADEL